MAQLQIIGIPNSNFVRTVRMAAHEKGVPYEHIPLPPHAPEVKAIHPAGRIPVMRHGETTLFESRAIARYIDEHFEGPPLSPREKTGDALVEQWVSYLITVTDQLLIRRYVFAYIFPKTPDNQPDRAAIEAMQPKLASEVEVLDKAVARGHLVGDKFTLADIYLMAILASARRFPELDQLIRENKNLARYYDQHAARESFKATMPPARKAA
jgi:glutathione S-transferase